MKTFKNTAAQGELYFSRVDEIPADAKPQDHAIVGHSETGHHHMFAKDSGVTLYETSNPLIAYLRVESASMLEHHKSFDTHSSIQFSPGTYQIRRGREMSPEGWRAVQD